MLLVSPVAKLEQLPDGCRLPNPDHWVQRFLQSWFFDAPGHQLDCLKELPCSQSLQSLMHFLNALH